MCDNDPRSAASWPLRYRWPLAWLALVTLAAAAPLSWNLTTSRSIEAMFADDDPDLIAYRQLQQAFGGNAVVMLVYRDQQLMSREGIVRAADLSEQVAALPGIRGVLSVAELNDLLGMIGAGGVLGGSQGDLPPLLRDRDVMVRAMERLFAGYTHSADGQTAALVALLEPAPASVGYAAVLDPLQRLAADLPAPAGQGVLVGEPVLVEQGFDLIERDGRRLAWWTLGLLSVCVWWMLRSPRYVLLQLAVIIWAVTVTRATLALLGMQLSLVSSVLTAIVTVIAVTAVIHLGSRQRIFRGRGETHWSAGRRTLAWVMPAIFWACATDAAGFLALTASGVVPVQEFGWMMAIASIAVWVAVLLVAPLFLVTTVGPDLPASDRGGRAAGWAERAERCLRRRCLRTAVLLMRYRGVVLTITALLGGLTWLGVSRLEIESSFLRNFRDDGQIVQAYQQVEADLNGAGVWDVVLPAPDELNQPYFDSVRTLERRLRAIDVDGHGLTKVLSIADAERIATVNPLLRIASPSLRVAGMRAAIPAFADALLVPEPSELSSAEAAAEAEPEPEAMAEAEPATEALPAAAQEATQAAARTADQAVPADSDHRRYLRIMLRSAEQLDTPTKMRLIREVQQVVAEHTQDESWSELLTGNGSATADSDGADGQVTGYYVLLARLVSRLIDDQWLCLLWAAALIWALLWLATRSLVWASLAVIPNLLPVMMVLAAVGWMGEKMNMGAAMIAAVSIGLSIDGSVHFLNGFGRQWKRHRNTNAAVLFAQRQIGLPLVMATLSLVVGFAALATSEFVPTATFGQLTAAALVIGTTANLMLMPVLMQRGRLSLRKPTPPRPASGAGQTAAGPHRSDDHHNHNRDRDRDDGCTGDDGSTASD